MLVLWLPCFQFHVSSLGLLANATRIYNIGIHSCKSSLFMGIILIPFQNVNLHFLVECSWSMRHCGIFFLFSVSTLEGCVWLENEARVSSNITKTHPSDQNNMKLPMAMLQIWSPQFNNCVGNSNLGSCLSNPNMLSHSCNSPCTSYSSTTNL